MDDAPPLAPPVPAPEARATAMFFLNGVLFAGTLIAPRGAAPGQDGLLTALTWPAETRVLVGVRLAASDAAVASCAALPPDRPQANPRTRRAR